MRVILHADDFGYDNDTVAATIDLFEKGCLSSASIMATMPAAGDALKYAAEHQMFSFGVHLTYVDGLLPAIRNEKSSLLDENRLFYPSNDVRRKALLFKLKQKEIISESLAQINLVKDVGVGVSHLDSHGHLHKFPAFLEALPKIKKQSEIAASTGFWSTFYATLIGKGRLCAWTRADACLSGLFRLSAWRLSLFRRQTMPD